MRPHVPSFVEFLGEAAEVFTHADSRLWRTIAPLLFRPGFLTQQFLQGRRASYLPPFRLYIVVSLLFFLSTFRVPRRSLRTQAFRPARREKPGRRPSPTFKGNSMRPLILKNERCWAASCSV